MEVKEIGGRKVIILNQVLDEDTSVATMLVRASTENLINDVERALDDGIQSVKTLCSDGRLLPGAGECYVAFCCFIVSLSLCSFLVCFGNDCPRFLAMFRYQ